MGIAEQALRIRTLSDDELQASLRSVLGSSRKLVALLLAHLGEVEERGLHLLAAHESMFTYCTRRLGMSEDEACRRIDVARLARRFPALLDPLARGHLSLSVAALLKPHLTLGNHVALIAAVSGKTVSRAREVLAAWFPRPDVPATIRKLPERRVNAVDKAEPGARVPATPLFASVAAPGDAGEPQAATASASALSARNARLMPTGSDRPTTQPRLVADGTNPPTDPNRAAPDTTPVPRACSTAAHPADVTAPRAAVEHAATAGNPTADGAAAAVESSGPEHVATNHVAAEQAAAAPSPTASGVAVRAPVDKPGSDCGATAHLAAQHAVGAQVPLSAAAPPLVVATGPVATSPAATTHSGHRARPSAVRASRPSLVEPLSPERYRVQFTADAELKQKLELARDLLRHAVPNGDLPTIIGRALDLLLERTLRRRFAKSGRQTGARASTSPSDAASIRAATRAAPGCEKMTANEPSKKSPSATAFAPVDTNAEASIATCHGAAPDAHDHAAGQEPGAALDVLDAPCSCAGARPRAAQSRSRPLPSDVRRAVLERDGLRCTWVGPDGMRCESRAWLEHDHIIPRGLGGADDPENIRIRCRSHNQLAAQQAYGKTTIARIVTRRRAARVASETDAASNPETART